MAKNYFKNAPIAKTWRRSTYPIRPQELTNFTSFNLGDLVPLYKPIDILPHDTFVFDLGSLIQMPDPMVAPIMDGLKFSAYAFWVPKRLLWNDTKAFYGQSEQAGVNTNVEFMEPRVSVSMFSNKLSTGGQHTRMTADEYRKTIAHHFGVPFVDKDLPSSAANAHSFVNILPFRAYYLIWNYYFRDQNLQNSYILNLSGRGDEFNFYGGMSNKIITHTTDPNLSTESVQFGFNGKLLKAAKKHDYFTSLLPYEEKTANPVLLPLQGEAIVQTSSTAHDMRGIPVVWQDQEDGNSKKGVLRSKSNGTGVIAEDIVDDSSFDSVAPANLVANLRTATSTSIRTLQEAFALHHLYQIDAIGGTRYDEQIFAHFGTRPLAESFKPEELGEIHFDINVDQVVAHASSSGEELGQRGAYSITGNKNHLVTKSFTEPGYIILLGVARQTNHIYSQGLDPVFIKHRRFDYYYDAFKNIGLVPKSKREIMVQDTADDDDVFGFGEYGQEYRHFTPMVSGFLDPNLSGSLDYWTLADKLPANVSLSSEFIKEDPSNLARALSSGSTTDQFVARFGIKGKMTRVVPVYSIAKGIL